jgi:hypothetical protein
MINDSITYLKADNDINRINQVFDREVGAIEFI